MASENKMKVLGILLLTAFLLPQPANSLFFYLQKNTKRCFIEEVPDDTLVIGNYKLEIFDKTLSAFSSLVKGEGLHVEVQDPSKATILSKSYNTEGRFAFTSHMHGEHTICLTANSTDNSDERDFKRQPLTRFLVGERRVHLNIVIGGKAVDYDVVKKKEKLTAVQLKIRKLLDLVEQIRKEQEYQQNRETRFRQTSESTNSRVFWWAFIQTIALAGMTYWQVRHLKTFFLVKKLV